MALLRRGAYLPKCFREESRHEEITRPKTGTPDPFMCSPNAPHPIHNP